MGFEDYRRQLREHGEYRTPAQEPRRLSDRIFGRLDGWYYFRLLQITLSANRTARAGGFDRDAWADHGYRTLESVENCGGTVSIEGAQHIVGLDRPVVYIANHMSMLETYLLPGAIILPFQQVTTVVKESLLTLPLFGIVMRSLAPITVTRRHPREDLKTVLTRGAEVLKRGTSVLVFPQATRRAVFDPDHFNSLGVKLARRAGVPVVPVALKTDFQGIGRILKETGRIDRSKTVHFKFGPALGVEGNGQQTHERVLGFVLENLGEWGAQIRNQKSEVRDQSLEIGEKAPAEKPASDL